MTRHQHETFLLKRCDVLLILFVLGGAVSPAIGIVGVWQFSKIQSLTLPTLLGLTAKLIPSFVIGALVFLRQPLKVLLEASDRCRADERIEELFRQVDAISDSSKRDSTRSQLIITLAQRSQLDVSSEKGRASKLLNSVGFENLGKSLLRTR